MCRDCRHDNLRRVTDTFLYGVNEFLARASPNEFIARRSRNEFLARHCGDVVGGP